MEKNKILEAARNNKVKGREFENKESIKSSLLGSIVSTILGIALFLIEYFVKNDVNVSLIAVGMAAFSVQSIYEGIKTKRISLLLVGIVQVIIVLFAILIFMGQVFAS